ncbi:MAG: radical SAM protein [Planctomycetota bacterium]
MAIPNLGVCETCKRIVKTRHTIENGKVYLTKECATCGTTSALVSSDAAVWQKKRDIFEYKPDEAAHACGLNCLSCDHAHRPRMAFLNVTNRCNMNCPICIANIPGMGFEFHPPLDYFRRVLDGLAAMDPLPTVNLFGGEPTVREDMFEIIKMAESRGLRIGIVTNGLRLADEAFCKRVCDSGARVLIAFDGRGVEIYERLRKNAAAYEKKLKAFENLKKFTNRKHTIMCCVARKVNDKHVRDLIDFCHENRSFIANLHMIPLTENWKEGEFSSDITTTIEDVEEIVREAFPGERVEFIPAGLPHRLKKVFSFFGSPRLTFGGVHPNCESAMIFFSDGERYWPVSEFLKVPMADFCHDVLVAVRNLDARMERLDPKRFFGRWRGRIKILRTLLPLMRRGFNLRRMVRGRPSAVIFKILAGLLFGRSLKDLLRKHTRFGHTLGMIILPFEERHSVEAERLKYCTSGFALEDPDTGAIRVIPVCTYPLFRDDLERRIAAKCAAEKAAAAAPAPSGAPTA